MSSSVPGSGDPVVYVSTWRIQPGRYEEYARFHRNLTSILRDREPTIVAFVAFANEDGTEITHVHAYRDAAALEEHMGVLAEQMGLVPDDLRAVTELAEPVSIQVLGRPGETAARLDQGLADQGVPFVWKRRYLAGFTGPAD